MDAKKKYFLLSLLIIVLLYLSYTAYIEVRKKAISDHNRHQMLIAKQASIGIENFFEHHRHELNLLTTSNHIINFSDQGKILFDQYYSINNKEINAATLMNAEGKIIYTTPKNDKIIGNDISYQEHVKKIMAIHRPVISDVFTAVQGYKAVAYHVPIMKDDEFIGSIGILISFNSIASRFLDDAQTTQQSKISVISENGIELYCSKKEHVGKTIGENTGNTVSAISMFEKMKQGNSGTAICKYKTNSSETTFHVAFTPAKIENTFWSIAVATKEDLILSTLTGFTTNFTLIALIFIIVSSIFFTSTFKALSVLREENKRREAEKALVQNERKYRSLMENANDAIFLAEAETGIIVDVNKQAENLLGIPAEKIIGMHQTELHPPEKVEVYKKVFKDHTKQSRGLTENMLVRRSDGSDIPVSISANTYEYNGKKYLQGVFRNMTEFKQLEEQLRHSEKMQAVGQLAGGIAHDFNNQLTGIMGNADLLAMSLEDAQLKMYAENILKAANRSKDLTQQLLAFARKGKYQSTEINMHNIILDVIEMLEHSIDKRIRFCKNFDAQKPITIGDPTQIQNAVLNLALNARDAMPNGGELIFATDNVKLDEKYCCKQTYEIKPGDYIKISVTDTGIGMNKDLQSRIFEPFFTTKDVGKGTGMGLAAVYGTMKNHKGAINIYSEPKKGTTVNLYLPLDEQSEKTLQPVSETNVTKGTGNILLVDDENSVVEAAQVMLNELGYDVIVKNNGLEALIYYKNNFNEIDLVLLDMVMPIMAGEETFAEMKKINPDIKCILSSGYSINGEAQSILDEGVLDFIQKPYSLAELSVKIKSHL